MLPAPVPGVGRRQCYLNVIKGGHQSWGSTTRRPVGRDDGCVPPFWGNGKAFQAGTVRRVFFRALLSLWIGWLDSKWGLMESGPVMNEQVCVHVQVLCVCAANKQGKHTHPRYHGRPASRSNAWIARI